MITTHLRFPTEADYLDYSKALCNQMQNIKLCTLRNAMAKVDGYQTTRSYRTALQENKVKPVELSKIYRQGNYLCFDALVTLDHSVKLKCLEQWNDYIEKILIGQAYGMQEPCAEHVHGNVFRCTGYIDLDDTDDEVNTSSAISFFTTQYHKSLAINMITESAINFALNYLAEFNPEDIHPDIDISLDEYTLPCKDDLLRENLPSDAIDYYEQSIASELIENNNTSFLSSQALKDCWESVLTMAIQQLAAAFLQLANKDYINANDFNQLSDPAIVAATPIVLENIILNQF